MRALKVQSVACGGQHAAAVLQNGKVFFWSNDDNELPPQTIDTVQSLENVVAVSCGFAHSIFLLDTQKVVCVGSNHQNQCHSIHTTLDKVQSIAAGVFVSMFLLRSNQLIVLGKVNGQWMITLDYVIRVQCLHGNVNIWLEDGSVILDPLNQKWTLSSSSSSSSDPVKRIVRIQHVIVVLYESGKVNSYLYPRSCYHQPHSPSTHRVHQFCSHQLANVLVESITFNTLYLVALLLHTHTAIVFHIELDQTVITMENVVDISSNIWGILLLTSDDRILSVPNVGRMKEWSDKNILGFLSGSSFDMVLYKDGSVVIEDALHTRIQSLSNMSPVRNPYEVVEWLL